MKMKEEKTRTIQELKEYISEFIGELKGSQVSINGKTGQVIIDVQTLIGFLKEVREKL